MKFNVKYEVWGATGIQTVEAESKNLAIAEFKRLASLHGSPSAKILAITPIN